MRMKKLVALVAMLAVLCTAFSGLTLVKAAEYELVTGFESSMSLTYQYTHENSNRDAGEVIIYKYGFDLNNVTPSEPDDADYDGSGYKGWEKNNALNKWYTGANHTATNEHGIEIAVNKNGIVIQIEDNEGKGNMQIPEDGFVISAHYDEDKPDNKKFQEIKIGDAAWIYEKNICFARTTDDSSFTHISIASELKQSALVGSDVVLAGEDSPTGTYDTDVLVKLTVNEQKKDNSTDYANKGYVVKYGNFGTENVPEGYMVLPLREQSLVDNESDGEDAGKSIPKYTASYAFEQYGDIGSIVSVTLDSNKQLKSSVFFRFDAAAAVRNALLLTGISGEVGIGSSENDPSDTVTINADEFADSAKKILDDAKNNYRLVDIDTMQSLYNQMVACTNVMVSKYKNKEFQNKDQVEPYHATIKSLYKQIYDLSFETRPVEMRATWWRPFSNTGAEIREMNATQITQYVNREVARLKGLGYNMIFVESLFNSTTIYPTNGVGHNDLSFTHNPNLVPVGEGGLNSHLSQPYDMLQAIIDACHEYGVEPHIQWTTFYVAYCRNTKDSDDQFQYSIAKTIIENQTKYKDWLNTNISNVGHTHDSTSINHHGTGDCGAFAYPVGGETYHFFLNPASEGATTFLHNNFKYVMENYDVESIQLDYIRYPHGKANYYYGYDDTTIQAFMNSDYYNAESHGTTLADVKAKLTKYPTGENWINFRADLVTAMVKDIYDLRDAVAPHIYLTSSPGPEMDKAKADTCQNIAYWLQEDYIDIVFPMAYGQNVPGHIAAGMVETCEGNTENGKFVCIGTDNDYFSKEYEMRWMRESRAAGADGIASFCESEMYKDDLWKDPAITPTGDATKAAMTYLQQVVAARVDKMVALGDVNADQKDALTAAINEAAETIRLYGIEADEVETALDALQTAANAIGNNPKTAITNDVTYLKKIKNNARDNAKETAGVTVNTSTDFGKFLAANNDDNSPIRYTASTKVLIVKGSVTLSGTDTEDFDIYVEGGEKTVHLKALKIGDTTLKVIAGDNMQEVTVRLSGETVMSSADFLDNAKHIYGVGTIVDKSGNPLRVQGDVDSTDTLNTNDVREILRANVGKVTLSDTQKAFADANGDRKINTTDARLFLEKSLGKIA